MKRQQKEKEKERLHDNVVMATSPAREGESMG